MRGMRSGSSRWLAGLLATFWWTVGAVAGAAAAEAEPTAWTLDPPGQHRVSAPALARLRDQLQQSEPSIRALLLLRDGRPVFEYYRAGLTAQTLHPANSITKSVVSTLVGIAIAQGRLDSADRPLPTLFDEAKAPGTAPEVAHMRLQDLLTQRSGFERVGDTHGWYSAYTVKYPKQAVMEIALQRPVQAPPGTRFLYSNMDTHLVSVALGRQLGQPLADYARDALFKPLGIRDWQWPALQGHTNGSGNLQMSARDLARLGQLWLQKGEWERRQLIAPAYFAEATRSVVTDLGAEYPSRGPSRIGYGYLFWTAEGLRPGWKSFYASGFGGQFVLVVPTHQVVIVALTDPDDWAPEKSAANTAKLLRERVVPAIAD